MIFYVIIVTILAVSCALNWTAAFLVGKFFPVMQNLIGEYVFVFFAAVSLFCMLFLGKFAPETKGKSFSQIDAEFAVMNGTKVPQTDEERTLKSEQESN